MKTTLEIPDDLMRDIKVRAAQGNRKLKDEVTDLLRRGIAAGSETPRSVTRRVRLPLVDCAHAAAPEEEVSPERAAQILLDEETPKS